MIADLQLFWDFFFYPLTMIDGLDLISNVLLMCVVVYSVFQFVMWCVEWSMSIAKK